MAKQLKRKEMKKEVIFGLVFATVIVLATIYVVKQIVKINSLTKPTA